MQETRVRFLGQEDPLEEGMATRSSILVWKIPWTEEPGRLVYRVTQSQTRLKRLSMHIHIRNLPHKIEKRFNLNAGCQISQSKLRGQ